MDSHRRHCRFQRLVGFAIEHHKCWIAADVENGAVARVHAVEIEAYSNQRALGPLRLVPPPVTAWPLSWIPMPFSAPRVRPRAEEWWFNGWLLCNTAAPWGTRGLETLKAVFSELALPRGLWGRVIINRRDWPWVRADGRHPWPWRDAWLGPEWFEVPLQRPLSYYGGPLWADLLIPPPEHWTAWADTAACRALGPVSRRRRTVMFRGTLTGRHMDARNPRISVPRALRAAGVPCDAGLTAWTARERVEVQGTEVRVVFPPPCTEPLVPALLPREQSECAVHLCLDGHVASSRLAWQLCSGSVVLLARDPAQPVPDMWFSRDMEVAHWGSNGFDVTAATHMFQCTPDEAPAAAAWLLDRVAHMDDLVARLLAHCERVFSRPHMLGVVRTAVMHALE